MIKLYDSQITDILPNNLKDYDAQALSYAISNQIKKIMDYSKLICTSACIDLLPADILDLMALEYNTQYYDQALPIEVKRVLIKNTLKWYERAGTPAAVEELVTAVFGYGAEKEWYEYGGEPGHFKLQATNQSINGEKQQLFLKLLDSIKRKSAWLDEVEIITDGEMTLNIFTGSVETSFEFSKPIKVTEEE